MKNLFYIIAIILIFTACEKVVYIDLNDANPRIVVDAQLTDTGTEYGSARIDLSWSGSFYEDNTFNPIEGALVRITDPRGNIYPFLETEKGVYTNSAAYKVFVDDQYTLDIVTDEESLTATTTMPTKVEIDSLSYEDATYDYYDEGARNLICYFTDPPNEENFYYFKIYINDTLQEGIHLYTDEEDDGDQIKYTYFYKNIVLESDVVFELYTLDEISFEYFYQVSADQGSYGMSAAPGNPPSNIEGNAIGLFRGMTKDVDEIVIPKANP